MGRARRSWCRLPMLCNAKHSSQPGDNENYGHYRPSRSITPRNWEKGAPHGARPLPRATEPILSSETFVLEFLISHRQHNCRVQQTPPIMNFCIEIIYDFTLQETKWKAEKSLSTGSAANWSSDSGVGFSFMLHSGDVGVSEKGFGIYDIDVLWKKLKLRDW